MTIKPTEEQKTLFHFVKKRYEHVLVRARAGSGKTTSAIECSKLLPQDRSIMFLAFNKHIQEELKTKLPEHIRCYTTYGLGNAAIKRKYGDKIKFDEFKIDKIIQKRSLKWELNDEFDNPEEIMLYLNSIKKLVNLCRLTLTVKTEFILNLAEKHEINLKKQIDFKRVLKILDEATTNRKFYDFTDMVYLPAIDKSIWMFPQDYVFVDELQDTNMCQLRIVEKILKKDKISGKIIGRLFTFGDNFQAIYGFNGSDERIFNFYQNIGKTKELTLTTSFRCSKNVIKKAQEIVPDIKALDDAPEGFVGTGSVLTDAKSGDFVLCRTTMPLVKLFFEFLIQNKKAIIKGSDIGIQLIELIGEIKTIDNLIKYWNKELIKFKHDLNKEGILNPNEHSGYSALEDKVITLLFLAKLSNTILELKASIKTIFTDEIKGIVLSTIHKIKGLEADRVFIIRPDLLPLPNVRSWQYVQEKNLEYVAITRAKLDLIYDNEWTDEEQK